jgi:uncharacterized membrane protein
MRAMEENPVGAPVPPPQGAQMPPGAPPTAPGMQTGRPGPVNDTSKLLAAGGYLIWIVALIAVLMDPYKNEKFVKFHAVQGIAMNIGWVAVMILQVVLGMIFAFIPYIGWIFSLILQFLWLAYLVYLILLAVKAYNGNYVEVPIVYGIVKGYVGE